MIGNAGVSPTPSYIIPNSTIQNGPDAVAIYQGSILDYQEYTPASTNNLIHAIGHGNTARNILINLSRSIVDYVEQHKEIEMKVN